MATLKEHMEEITIALENGIKAVFDTDRFRGWLEFMGKFPTYSFRNQIICFMSNPAAEYFCGMKQWNKDFHRTVIKGQHPIWILAPIFKKVKEKDENGEEVEITKLVGYKPVMVYGDNQTTGDPLPSICKQLEGKVNDYTALVDKITAYAPCSVSFGDARGANGYYSPTEDRIVVAEGMSEKQTLKTLIHETAHSILHRKGAEEENTNRRRKETEAEAVAYAVCSYLGIDTSEYSFEYLASWASGRELKELQECLTVIQSTACDFIKAVA